MRASKGIHLVVPRDRIQLDTGLILRTEKSVLFVIPWGRHWIIGTTDTDWELDKAHPAASRADIDYVLEQVNARARRAADHEDVEGVYAGLRPLLTGESESTSSSRREHTVAVPVPGPGRGGRRQVHDLPGHGRDAVDAAARGSTSGCPPRATDDTPLVGAEGFQALWNGRGRLAARAGLHVARIEHLLQPLRLAASRSCSRRSRERPELGEPLRAPTTTCGSRSATPPPTRAPSTSTTCSPAARGSRSRRSTAGSRPPSRPPA